MTPGFPSGTNPQVSGTDACPSAVGNTSPALQAILLRIEADGVANVDRQDQEDSRHRKELQ